MKEQNRYEKQSMSEVKVITYDTIEIIQYYMKEESNYNELTR